jgi:hypothetical protein
MGTYSLMLNWDTWDLQLDSNGNLAMWPVSQYNNSVAQDAACAIKTFIGDCWYNNTLGLPYFQGIFGQNPPLSWLSAKIVAQCLTMSNITRAVVLTLSLVNVPNGASLLTQLKGTVLVWPLGSSEPIPVNF